MLNWPKKPVPLAVPLIPAPSEHGPQDFAADEVPRYPYSSQLRLQWLNDMTEVRVTDIEASACLCVCSERMGYR